jgi:hypothetical protein
MAAGAGILSLEAAPNSGRYSTYATLKMYWPTMAKMAVKTIVLVTMEKISL